MQPMIAWAKPKGSCGTRMPAPPFFDEDAGYHRTSRRAAGNRTHVSKAENRIERAIRTPQRTKTAVWIKTRTAAPSGLGKSQFSTFDDSADPWKDIADGKVVHLSDNAARRIFDKNDGIAVFPRLSCVDSTPMSVATPPERLSGYRGGATANPALFHERRPHWRLVTRMSPGFAKPSSKSLKFQESAGRMAKWPIDRLSQGVFEILGEAYIHENNWRACFTKCICKSANSETD